MMNSFYDELNLKVGNYIRQLTSDKDQIDEVTQEALLKIHKSINTLQNEEKLGSWIKRIVYTTLMDYHRKNKLKVQFDILDDTLDEAVVEENEGNSELMLCILFLLKDLPAEERELLEMVELKGISQTEYAKAHNMSISTVKSRVQRAKQKLKKQITSTCFLKMDSYGNVVDYKLDKK